MGMIDDLRRLLSESGYSANEIGRRTGVSPSQVSRYLRGERTLSMPVIEKLCDGLGYQLVRVDDDRLTPTPGEPTDADLLKERPEQPLASKSGRQAPRPEEDRDERRRIEDRAMELAVEIVAKLAGRMAEEIKRGYRA
jgi:transcriptional regulator with XRE-family HTH domain